MNRIYLLLIVAAAAQEHTPERDKNPFAGNPDAVAAGQKIYEQTCQACHGGSGRGSERGPALTSGRFTRGGLDGEIFLTIRNGVKGTQMPGFAALKQEQVWQLVSYIRGISGGAVATGEKVLGDAASGERLFFGKAQCASCHGVNARGGIVGPDLSAAGRMPTERLQAKILNPSGARPGRRRRGDAESVIVTARTKEGRELRGMRTADDTFTVHLVTAAGERHMLTKAGLAELRAEPGTFMPADYGKRLSAGEIQDVVAYLKTLEGRDFAKTVGAVIPGGLTYERMKNASAEPQNWLAYWGDYRGSHFSALRQIDGANVKRLQMKWAAQMPGDSLLQSTPVVVDGVMYTAGPPGQVFALDARTGVQIWKYQRQRKTVNPYESNPFNRGVAVLGNRVFVGTLDAALVALDARTGLPLWEVQVADTMQGYSLTMAPLAVKDKIIVGVAGGEHGIRGFLDAYDAASGKRAWRFHTVPGPGELGHETWKGDSWKMGGSGTWLTGSFDPELNLIYWATGNPGPDMDAEIRKGDNLFSCSVLALDADTGKRKWHYQFTPGDDHDWDANEGLVLADHVIDGQPRKLLLHANRNGFFYVLDRTDGKFLFAKPFVKQTWNDGFDDAGRPIWKPNSKATPEGTVVYPSLVGGTNWQSPSYDASSETFYLMTSEAGQRFFQTAQEYEPGKAYWGGRAMAIDEPSKAAIKAIDAATGTVKWQYPVSRGSLSAGVLATAGGVLFSSTQEGNLLALDARSGQLLWRTQTGGAMSSSPMSYAVDGKQFVAVSAGGVLYAFGLPE
ncbi:MAG: PQQ-dependent dehydrogenase, methanol/ethanol family [Bryobacteraceae bacterium]